MALPENSKEDYIMPIFVSKYELWNALFMCPDEHKTEKIKELEKQLNDTMRVSYMVVVSDMSAN